MKSLLALCLFVVAPLAFAEAPASIVKGVVLETMNAGGYTYLRLKTRDGETWAAINQAVLSKGAEVAIENAMEMHDFESKTLKKTFPNIVFGTLASAATAAADMEMAAAHSSVAKAGDVDAVNVPKAVGANALTIAEIIAQSAALNDKPVLVRGKVVKYNPMILGRNWIHLRDGSGTAADNTNDLLVTSTNPAKLGDVVTVNGVVRVNQDFGAGYVYKVLIEEATITP